MQILTNRLSIIPATLLFLLLNVANAAEYKLSENLPAESAHESPVAINMAGGEQEVIPSRKLFNFHLNSTSPFLRDSETTLDFRVMDFARDHGGSDEREAFAAGSELTFTSGKWRDRLSLGATWHTSIGIDAPKDKGNTDMLAPDQSNLRVLSRAYLNYDLSETATLQMYRQDFDMPYINRQDSRMIPNTHEAYMIRNDGEQLTYIFGHITKMKERDSERFVTMGKVAGASDSNSGTSLAGVRYNFPNDIIAGALVQNTDDVFTTTYAETNFSRRLTDSWGMQLAAQYTDQRSNGSAKLGRFYTYSWGLSSKLSYRGAILTTAYSRIGEDAGIRRPFGGTPGFTSSMLYKFDRADEKAWRLGLSQNFTQLGLPGVSFVVNYTNGRDAKDEAGLPLGREDEIAVTADFRPQSGPLEGLWLRVRYAKGSRDNSPDDNSDLRIILSFRFGAFS